MGCEVACCGHGLCARSAIERRDVWDLDDEEGKPDSTLAVQLGVQKEMCYQYRLVIMLLRAKGEWLWRFVPQIVCLWYLPCSAGLEKVMVMLVMRRMSHDSGVRILYAITAFLE